MRDLRSHCLALAILALASGAVGASAAVVPTVLSFPLTGIFFAIVLLVAMAYLVTAPRFWAAEISQPDCPTAAQCQTFRAANQQLAEQLAAQQQETAQLMEDKTLLQFLKADQELERQRIAEDLHDQVLQNLTGLLMHWETEAERPQIQGKTLLPGVAVLREVFRHGRQIMNRLSASSVTDEGVVAHLERLTSGPARAPLVARFEANVEFDRLAPLTECALIRIARETLEHLEKECAAREATVRLNQLDSHLLLDIRGFCCGKPHSPAASDLLLQLTQTADLIDARVSLENGSDSIQLRLDVPLGPSHAGQEKRPTAGAVVPERPGRRL